MTKHASPDMDRTSSIAGPQGAPDTGRSSLDRHRRRTVRGLALVIVAGSLSAAACADENLDTSSESSTTSEAPSDIDIVLSDSSIRAEAAVSGFDQPSSLAFIDDGMLVTEKATGVVHVVRDDVVVGEAIDLAVNSFDERGLLGVAVHPEFPSQPYVYLHWTWRGEGGGSANLLGDDSDQDRDLPALGNRIDRFRWDDDELSFDRNIVEYPSNTLDADTSDRVRGNHDAGPLAFGPDGKLYTMLGDQNLRGQLQNIVEGPEPDDAHLAGVILRLNDDGTVPQDNPFFIAGEELGGEVGANLQTIYAYGIRNSFGLAFEPGSGALWMSENGDDSYDEINVLDAGANSGWIQIQGPPSRFDDYRDLEISSEDGLDVRTFPPTDLARSVEEARARLFPLAEDAYSAPILSYVHPPAVTAIAFTSGGSFGGDSGGFLWVGTVLTDALIRYPVGQDGRSLELTGVLADGVDDNSSKGELGESATHVVGTGFGVITDIDLGPDGSLYVVSLDTGTIFRLSETEG